MHKMYSALHVSGAQNNYMYNLSITLYGFDRDGFWRRQDQFFGKRWTLLVPILYSLVAKWEKEKKIRNAIYLGCLSLSMK